MHFNVAVAEYIPYLKVNVESDVVHMSGIFAEFFHSLSVSANFTYTLHKVKDDIWGVRTENGWTGMLGMLERDEVDMAIGPFTMTYDRWSSFKLSDVFYVDQVTILAPAPEWKMTLFSAVSVFTFWVWMLTFISMFFLSVLTTALDKCREGNIHLFQRCFQNFWNILCVLLQKGRKEKRTSYIRSFLRALWMFSAFVLSSVFGGIMLTKLFVRKVQKIDSIEDLISAPQIQPIVEDGSSVHGAFKRSEDEKFKTIFQRITKNPAVGLSTFETMSGTGMDLVLSGTAAMITDSMNLKGFMGKRYKEGFACHYWLAKESLLTMRKTIALNQKLPNNWTRKINRNLMSILESGWLQHRMEEEYRHYEKCIPKQSTDFSSLGLQHTKGIFLIWAFGIAIALFIFACELFRMYPESMFS